MHLEPVALPRERSRPLEKVSPSHRWPGVERASTAHQRRHPFRPSRLWVGGFDGGVHGLTRPPGVFSRGRAAPHVGESSTGFRCSTTLVCAGCLISV